MHEITTTMEINAPPRSVWTVLVDFPSHQHWNPFVRRVDNNRNSLGRLAELTQALTGNAVGR
jgi:uncharacterized protein YndB with AHSA1/START domain